MTVRSILLDEGADRRLTPWLRSEGRDVAVVGLDYPGGIDDSTVLAIALREGWLLITRDVGFGRLVVNEGLPHAGVILLRVRERRHSLELQQTRLRHVFPNYAPQLDLFLVVKESEVRVR